MNNKTGEKTNGEKVFVSWSGGKDAYLSFLYAAKQGLEICSLLNFVGMEGYSRSHGLKSELLERQALAMGICLTREKVTWQGYEEGFEKAVMKLKENGIKGGVFGDINLQEHRNWLEKMSQRCKIDYYLPLWGMEEKAVTQDLLKRGGQAIIVSLKNELLDEKWLGCTIDETFIKHCEEKGLSPCGEKGEFHTFVVNGPYFKERVKYETENIVTDGNRSFLQLR